MGRDAAQSTINILPFRMNLLLQSSGQRGYSWWSPPWENPERNVPNVLNLLRTSLLASHADIYPPSPSIVLSSRNTSYFNNEKQIKKGLSLTTGRYFTSVHFSTCGNREVTATGPSASRWHAQTKKPRGPRQWNINLTSHFIRLSKTIMRVIQLLYTNSSCHENPPTQLINKI